MKSGIYTMSAAEYHADPCPQPSLSASIISTLIDQSPAHAKRKHPRLGGSPYDEVENDAANLGVIAHALLLEGMDVAEVLDYPDWRTKEAKERRTQGRAAGKVPILRKTFEPVKEMLAQLKIDLAFHKEARDAFEHGKPEQVLIWEEDGLWCRARFDWLADSYKTIDDYKSTSGSAHPDVFSRNIFDRGSDIQAAWYVRGLQMLTGKEAQFRFVVQETYAPYASSVISPGPDVMMLAAKKIEFAKDVWRSCLEEDRWPSYPQRICYASLPAWEENRWLERETNAN